jgi:RNA-binding protein
MPAPTSPRKKSLMPSGDLRRRLRAAGHALSPVVQLGKLGTTEAIGKQIARALLDHELIKVKLGSECPETRFEVAEVLAAHPGVKVVQILGRTLLLYQRHPKKPRFEKGESAEKAQGAEKGARQRAEKSRRAPGKKRRS